MPTHDHHHQTDRQTNRHSHACFKMIFFLGFWLPIHNLKFLGFMNDCTELGLDTRAEWRAEERRGEERRGVEWTELDALGSSPDGRPAHYVTYLLTLSVCVCPARPGGPCQAPGPLSNGSSCLPACLLALLGTYYLLGNIRR
jgi:hypothetical protein